MGPLDSITELVIVCGHAICLNSRDAYDQTSWLLQPFQQADASTGKPSEHDTFLQHISAGASFLRSPSTLLVFSGGKTRSGCDVAEGYSYGQVLLHDRNLHGPGIRDALLQRRVAAECWATDSYQNLLFSMIYFWEKVGRWPENITIVTHAFKQDRFLRNHSQALRWPEHRIKVMGINPPFSSKELAEVTNFEAKCTRQWEQDPYGVREPLAGKRKQRKWEGNASTGVLGGIQDVQVKEQLKTLMRWTGGDSGREIFPYPLPWDKINRGTSQ
ncbi:hypothetical protein AAFC00_000914 [Neodothiora populina]|uniref:DUF218 domain-containing protein n=1 Tax=Neodothiora populina TaxID=2781224 RepID=A0ABR3PMF1_9PEZI